MNQLLDDPVTRYGRERWRLGFVCGLVVGLFGMCLLTLVLY
jgi:hypothetical protein